MKFTLILNLPQKGCSPNRSGTTRKHAKDIASYRDESCIAAIAAMGIPKPGQRPVKLSATFYVHKTGLTKDRYRPRDVDNALGSLKAAQDGIVDSGLIPNDSWRWVRWGGAEIVVDGTGRPRVELEVEQL